MNWISTKSEIPNTSEDVFALINEKEPIVAYYGVGRLDSDHNKDKKMWRNAIGGYVYPDGLITHFMYVPKL